MRLKSAWQIITKITKISCRSNHSPCQTDLDTTTPADTTEYKKTAPVVGTRGIRAKYNWTLTSDILITNTQIHGPCAKSIHAYKRIDADIRYQHMFTGVWIPPLSFFGRSWDRLHWGSSLSFKLIEPSWNCSGVAAQAQRQRTRDYYETEIITGNDS